jgi:uncharacterized protein YoxC
MDFQLILVLILTIITVNLLVVGFYIVVTLKDFRDTLSRMNKVLDDTSVIVHGIANPLTILTGLVSAFSNAINTSKAITSLRNDR